MSTKYITLAEVVKQHLESNKNKPKWWYYIPQTVSEMNGGEEIVTEDADFEIIQPKQLPTTIKEE